MRTLYLIILVVALALGFASTSLAFELAQLRETGIGEAERGALLYENHCTDCHSKEQIHLRSEQKAKDLNELSQWVERWSTQLKLDWSRQDKLDVIRYLNTRFYQFKRKG